MKYLSFNMIQISDLCHLFLTIAPKICMAMHTMFERKLLLVVSCRLPFVGDCHVYGKRTETGTRDTVES